jgi:hypothetical protein
MVFRLLLIFTILFTYSCTEEISEELKNSDSSNALTDAEKFTGKKITLDHKMSEELSYRMHKAGARNIDCALVSPLTGFRAEDYRKEFGTEADDPQGIDCIVEVQELDLYQNGLELELVVDEFLCEYVTYEPFKFYTYPTGHTVRTLYRLECEDEDCDADCGNVYDAIDNTVPGAPTFGTLVSPDTLTCDYDHSDEDGPNCDTGSIRIISYEKTGSLSETTCAANWTATSNTEEIECGGEFEACLGGPAVDVLPDPSDVGLIYENEDLEKLTIDFSIPSPYSRRAETERDNTNMYIANYSRICAVPEEGDKTGAFGYSALNFEDDFKGHSLEDLYEENNYSGTGAVNRIYDLDGSTNTIFSRDIGALLDLDSSVGSTDAYFTDSGQEYRSIGYSENPWRGVLRTSSYYSFKCLDKAYDVKAQIRLFVREWDREFSETTPDSRFDDISDYDQAASTQVMDSTYSDVNQGAYNDLLDWDDFFENANSSGNRVWLQNECVDTDSTIRFRRAAFPGGI